MSYLMDLMMKVCTYYIIVNLGKHNGLKILQFEPNLVVNGFNWSSFALIYVQ